MLSQTSEYALRAVLYLAAEGNGAPVKIERIAGALELPRNYLSKTLHQLSRAGVLDSGRGPAGGFRLAVPADQLLLAAVVAPFDPVLGRRQCLLGRPVCGDATACAAHGRWKEVAEQVRAFFGETSVADLLGGQGVPPEGILEGAES